MSNTSSQKNVSNFVNRAGKKLLATTAMTALGLVGLSNGAQAADDWTGHVVTGGGGSIAYDPAAPANTTNITQTGARVKVQGDADIKAGWTVNVAQDSSTSQYILFDVENGKSIIDGNLNANGEIFIFDRDGVVFGENSVVDVSSIVASSGQLISTDAQLDAGQVIINSIDGDGDVKNKGTITVGTPGGYGLAGFVAPNVTNSGVINATMGKVALAAGETVTLDLYGDGLVEIAVGDELADGLVKNSGDIIARGGQVKLAASIAKDAVENVINMSGTINASSASVQGGKIVLSGGDRGQVRVAGDVWANGTNGQDGGSVEISGENVKITEDGDVRARSIFEGSATAGEITLAADTNLTINGSVSAYGIDDTGHVYIRRTAIGSIGVGTGAGDFLISQSEVDNITAGALSIGGDNTTDVNVSGIDLSAFANSYLSALASSSINFFGVNNFASLSAFADDITLFSGSSVNATNSIFFDAPLVNLDGDLSAPSISGTAMTVNVNNNGNLPVVNEEIQDGVDVAADAGATVNVGAGTYTEAVLVDKDVRIIGAGRTNTFVTSGSSTQNAFTIDGDFTNGAGNAGRVGIFRMDINNSRDGVEVKDTATNLNDVIIGGASFTDNALTGVRVTGNSINRTLIQNTNFTDNGAGGGSAGEGDILFFLHNGDIELSNVHIQNNSPLGTADYGIQVRGSNTLAPSGDISLDNVSVAGRYRAALIGIQNYTELPSLTFNDVTIGGLVAGTPSANLLGDFAALYLGGVGTGDFSLGNTVFADLDPNWNYITNYSLANIDATGVSFEGVNGATATPTENFAIEDRVTHKMDLAAIGLVTWKDGEVFVTENTLGIQHGIDISDAGNIVNVDDSTYQENLLIDKSIKLTGHGTTMEYDVDEDGPGRGGNGNIITVTAAGVDIDPITFDGLGVADYGVNADGAGAAGLVVDGNTFKNFNEAGIYVAHNGAATGTIKNNTFEGSSTRGVRTGTLNGGYTLDITNNTIGTDGGEVLNGLLFGQVRNAKVNIIGGSIDAGGGSGSQDGDAIHFRNGTHAGAEININNVTSVSDGDESIDFQQAVRLGSTVNILGGSHTGGNNGVEFSTIAGTANITGTRITGNGTDKRGLNLLGPITGALKIVKSRIVGGDDGIGSNDNQNNTVDGGSFTVLGSIIQGINGDGIELGAVKNNATVNIAGNIGIQGGDDAIEFNGISGNSNVTVGFNPLTAGDNGVEFNGGSPSIETGADVTLNNNLIFAQDTGVLIVDDVTGAGTTFIAKGNIVSANNNGFDIDHVDNQAVVTIGGPGAFDGNRIIAKDGNGIEFDAGVDSNVLIQRNRISAGEDGINVRDGDQNHVTGVDNGAIVRILDNQIGSRFGDTIGDDGIDFDDSITGNSTVTISGNSIGRSGARVGDDGIDIDSVEGGATVNIVNNPNNYATDNGIEISGNVNNGTVKISGNNHGIHAGDHGIYFGGFVSNGSDIDIHDNIISADENNDRTGDGVHFARDIYTANINIGDGDGSSFGSNPSNFIRGRDGIHFAGNVNSGAKIVIDGNRIGYGLTSGFRPRPFPDRVSDDGIQFLGNIQGSGNVQITDNYINSEDDGVSVIGQVRNDARVKIGGFRDGNTINSDGDGNGVQFYGDVKDHSLVEISYNDIQADQNGIVFNGNTSNHIHRGHAEEILIAHNEIDGDQNGILFEGRASHALHDIVIRDNKEIRGGSEDGISHEGGINDAELYIKNNDDVSGRTNGINVRGFLFNNAKVEISDNTDVTAEYGDGIHVEDTGFTYGADVDVVNNHVHYTGDDGIQVIRVDGVDIRKNTVHDTGEETDHGDAISVINSDYADIVHNRITGAGRDGINVYGSDYTDVYWNNVFAEGGNRFLGRGQEGADRDGIHVEESDFVNIVENTISSDLGFGRFAVNQLGAGRHGIYVEGGKYADIKRNNINDDSFFFWNVGSVGNDGIHVERNWGVDIVGNDVTRTGDDGVYVYKSAFADVIGNKVNKTGGDGIDVEKSFAVDVKGNQVSRSRENGIEVQSSDYADIFFNQVSLSGENGIYVNPSDFVEIGFNKVFLSKDDGIDVNGGHFIKIYGNLVGLNGDDGIDVDGSRHVDIFFNKTFLNRENGIDVDANHYGRHKGPNRINIVGNKTVYNGENGIFVSGNRNVNGIELLVGGNTASDNGDNGIKILSQGESFSDDRRIDSNVRLVKEGYRSGEFNTRIVENIVENNKNNGLYMAGGYHDNIEVSGNTFTDNDIGALFESGTIDLTGERNFFNGGRVGLKFSPAIIGYEFPETDDLQETAFASANLFSGEPVFAPMELVDNTIGAQTFDGQSQFYVELDNGAFFDPGTPTLLNALDSTYVGTPFGTVTPSVDFPAGFTVAQLAFFESMFQHFNDDTTLGLFFFPLLPEINQEDIFQYFGANADTLSGLQVTILGLPTIPGGAPIALNSIEPAAGGETDPAALNAIETAAGGDGGEGGDASCFSGTTIGAAQNGPVNISYSGDAEDLLNREESCAL